MPDFTTEYHAHCESYKAFSMTVASSKKGEVYHVRYGEVDPAIYGCQVAWQCECKGFRFRKTCKHIAEAEKKRCGWNGFYDDGEVTKDGKCPQCGGETGAMGYAV